MWWCRGNVWICDVNVCTCYECVVGKSWDCRGMVNCIVGMFENDAVWFAHIMDCRVDVMGTLWVCLFVVVVGMFGDGVKMFAHAVKMSRDDVTMSCRLHVWWYGGDVWGCRWHVCACCGENHGERVVLLRNVMDTFSDVAGMFEHVVQMNVCCGNVVKLSWA